MGRPTTAKQRNARTRFQSEGLRGSARPLLGQGSAERSRRPMQTRATCLSSLSNVILQRTQREVRAAHKGELGGLAVGKPILRTSTEVWVL